MDQRPTLVLRADATPALGIGHVMRCFALAQAWCEDGGRAIFCGRIESDFLLRRLASEGIEAVEVDAEPIHTLEILDRHGLHGAWIVLDGYHFGTEWQEVLVAAGYRVLVLEDDTRLPPCRAHVILASEHDAKPSSVDAPTSTVILAGPRYRLLRRGFVAMPRRSRGPVDGAVVLVSFGGADSRNATCAAVVGLCRVLDAADRVIVVLGPLNLHEDEIVRLLDRAGFQYELHRGVDDMGALYGRADLAISAAGGSAWELAVCGVPSILVPIAENQLPGMRYLTAVGAALALHDISEMRGDEFPRIVRDLLADARALSAMARSGQAACDEFGASRVCRVLRCLDNRGGADGFLVRPAVPEDMEQVFRLVNDRTVRDNSFSPEPILLTDHATWFAERISSPNTAFYSMEFEGVVVAVARFDAAGEEAEVDVAVHPAFRGRRLAARMLRECSGLAASRLQVSHLRAIVFECNGASRRSFLGGGFRESGRQTLRGRDCVIYRWQA